MKTIKELNINDKINVKQHAINLYGKRWHTKRPNFIHKLNELQLHTILTSVN